MVRTGEVAQRLGEFATLSEDLSLITNTPVRWLTSPWSSCVHIPTQTSIIKNKSFLKTLQLCSTALPSVPPSSFAQYLPLLSFPLFPLTACLQVLFPASRRLSGLMPHNLGCLTQYPVPWERLSWRLSQGYACYSSAFYASPVMALASL